MTGQQDPAGRGGLRAGHADREQVIEALKDAFVQGRLTREELDVRAGRALAARDLAAGTITTAAVGIGFLVTGAIAGLALWWGTRSYHRAMV
jgi:pseudouridine-5'-phosphate glycosidase